ncbi:MerR family transcriptional regulator [Companilactobacillus allii]|uniref:MerR family transcriptional regulator n=1 Tax=Companilactobacillus allii TaxID=1847728 RepID=A0A1P8Q6G2_9LACO|nr:MerR family transcriptional regulator [Companilactobacillus allii]APX73422.1 MerR family transcriptional regulator [Companilactobacillus allii]USQ69892.1 MerR family transcriptional regulator [Companilactobacillus allii]
MNSKKVSELMDLTVDTLRYYERIGVIPPVDRDKNGYRDYKTNDLNWIFLAKNLRAAGLSIESLAEFASLAESKEDVKGAQKEILNEQMENLNEKLSDLQRTKDLLQYKIDTYDDHIAKFKSGELDKDNTEELWTMKHFKK